MSQKPDHSSYSQEVCKLVETLHSFKEVVEQKFDKLRCRTELVKEAFDYYHDEFIGHQVEVQQLKEQVNILKEENKRLKIENANLKELRIEHIQHLDEVVNLLNKRRRLTTDTLDSPLSPTSNQDQGHGY